jgi:putative intracellular protease/amidase
MEMLSFATADSYIKTREGWPTPDCEFQIDYVAESREPITPRGGAQILPSEAFAEVEGKQYDILFVPGGIYAPSWFYLVLTVFLRNRSWHPAWSVVSCCAGVCEEAGGKGDVCAVCVYR